MAVAGTVGIERCGVHIPRYRLSGAAVSAFWGGRDTGAARAVKNWDEDVLTMAVAAATRCLEGVDPATIDTVILASTTFPYAEKQSAALLVEALNLSTEVDAVDVASSLRSGTQALRLATDRAAVSGRRVLVVASDARRARPESREEVAWGDAAAAVLVGPEPVAELTWVDRSAETWLSTWRLEGERYGNEADARFASQRTVASLQRGLDAGVKAAADAGEAITTVAVAAQNPKDVLTALGRTGLPDGVQRVGADTFARVGYPGAAAPLLVLAEALDALDRPGTVLWSSVGDGADAALVHVRGQASDSGLAVQLDRGRALSYAQYVRVNEIIPDAPVVPFSSEIEQWRNAGRTARLQAARCRSCGFVAYPPQPVCPECKTHDHFEDHTLPHRGRIYTYTVEHLYPNAERRLAMAVVEFEDGTRLYCPVTDTPVEDLDVGVPVSLTYRRLHKGGGFVNYFWKAVVDGSEAGR